MKQSKKIIAVTGGIGSGKSEVLRHLRALGYATVSADAIAGEIYADADVYALTKRAFPDCVKDGVDRKKLAARVFADADARRRLEEITHPAIIRRLFAEANASPGSVVFAEVPLLFEGGYESAFDGVIVVMRPLPARIASVMARDRLTENEVRSRIQNQYDYEKNPPIGHTVLYNDGDVASLERQTERVLHEIFKIVHP